MEHLEKLRSAELLLKQGKVDAALAKLAELAKDAPHDLLTLNRMGDLLARQGRGPEAIGYYRRIATQFGSAGHYPKAIAIYKKILRLDPADVAAQMNLGRVYLAQKLPAEARQFLLAAADRFTADGEHAKAGEVFEELLSAEPDNLVLRARFAEAIAAAGDATRAAEQLLALADAQRAASHAEEAEQSYRRAAELMPNRPEPVLGLTRCLAEQSRIDEAIGQLERGHRQIGSPELIGELVVRYEQAGRGEDTLSLLGGPGGQQVPDEALERVFCAHLAAGTADAAWQRFDRLFHKWLGEGEGARVDELYDRLARIEEAGHVPALERWLQRLDTGGADPSAALERLARAYEAAGRTAEASAALDRLHELRASAAASTPHSTEASAEAPPVPVELNAEAPAVPLSRTDEEFVTGRLTQAEILEKYNLIEQALQQVADVTLRFPGHVLAQRRRVAMLRAGTDKAALRDALCGLALATRAAGDLDDAKHAASEAQALGEMPGKMLGILQQVGLLESAGPAPEPIRAAAPPAEPAVVGPAPHDAPSDVLIDLEEDVEIPAPSRGPADDDEDDLSAIAAALDGGLVAEGDAQPLTPDAGTEQSIDEVFAAFKERVNEEVAIDDFRTHYDLAIGYKEMGLLDAAIEGFQTAAGAPELRRDAMVMMGDCHREQGEAESAVRCYRGAIEAGAGADPAILTPVRYALASLLADSGQSEAALDAFREVQASDPDFRDVGSRIDALESQLTA